MISDEKIIEHAHERLKTHDLGFDETPTLARSDDGVWVQAWVWVYYSEIPQTDDDREASPCPR